VVAVADLMAKVQAQEPAAIQYHMIQGQTPKVTTATVHLPATKKSFYTTQTVDLSKAIVRHWICPSCHKAAWSSTTFKVNKPRKPIGPVKRPKAKRSQLRQTSISVSLIPAETPVLPPPRHDHLLSESAMPEPHQESDDSDIDTIISRAIDAIEDTIRTPSTS